MIIKHVKRTVPIAITSLLTIAVAVFLFLAYQSRSSAADISKFDPGNLMTDATMSNKNSMSVQQIQAFLNSKNACNNTNIHLAQQYPHLQYKIKDGRFVCMAQDSFNGQSAAQIIWEVSQQYSINPQVLIVLLEKEQGLVSDTWPNHIQYRTAAGFGCPDNLPPGSPPCEAQYFGLKNQLQHAANLFRTVLNGGWSKYPVGNTYVQYHPNAACGGAVINIKNRATSAMYRYTPYQPNRAALNAGYGTGDGCSAYGNRNSWMLHQDWFGTTPTIPIKGSIKTKYDSLGNARTLLGNAVNTEKSGANGFWWQQFERGYIVGTFNTGYFVSKGSIRDKWAATGFQKGRMGLPLSDEKYDRVNKIYSQDYQGGEIVSHSNGNIQATIKGSIYASYKSFNGKYRAPLREEQGDKKGNWWQSFSNGVIFGNFSNGYYESSGSIRDKWAEAGFQSSEVGIPTGNIERTSSDCYSQNYTNGVIKGCSGQYDIILNEESPEQ